MRISEIHCRGLGKMLGWLSNCKCKMQKSPIDQSQGNEIHELIALIYGYVSDYAFCTCIRTNQLPKIRCTI